MCNHFWFSISLRIKHISTTFVPFRKKVISVYASMVTISRLELELNVLSKMDPDMIELIDSAPFVAVYIYDMRVSQWKKTNQDGVLFIYKKSGKFPYHILVLNRETDNHFFQPITKEFKSQLEEPYLMYTNGGSIIYAFWFHEEEICTKITSQILKIVDSMDTNECVTKLEKKVDIIAMLQDAGRRYVHEVTCKPATSALNTNDYSSPSVLNFFMNASKTCRKPQPLTSPLQDGTFVKRLMDNPEYNLESIERQQKLLLQSNN